MKGNKKMKKKIAYILLAVLIIASIIVTAIKGLKVDLYYGEGTLITFNVGTEIDVKDIKAIAKEVWPNKKTLVQQVELFGDSASIKVQDPSEDELNDLCTKLNDQYSKELTTSNLTVEYVSNVKVSSVVEPYLIPVGLATLLVVAYYAIRFKGAKQMLNLVKLLAIAEAALFCIYALIRIPFNTLTMPSALILYTLILIGYTAKCEQKTK